VQRGLSGCGSRVFCDDLGNGWGQLGADAAPVTDTLVLEFDGGRLGAGIIGAYNFNGAAVAGAILLDDDDAVVGLLAGANARQTNHDHGDAVPFKVQMLLESEISGGPACFSGATGQTKGQTRKRFQSKSTPLTSYQGRRLLGVAAT
jgi:hypothetical protein